MEINYYKDFKSKLFETLETDFSLNDLAEEVASYYNNICEFSFSKERDFIYNLSKSEAKNTIIIYISLKETNNNKLGIINLPILLLDDYLERVINFNFSSESLEYLTILQNDKSFLNNILKKLNCTLLKRFRTICSKKLINDISLFYYNIINVIYPLMFYSYKYYSKLIDNNIISTVDILSKSLTYYTNIYEDNNLFTNFLVDTNNSSLVKLLLKDIINISLIQYYGGELK